MRLKLSSHRSRNGFTLVELMTVIVIIGIMTALIIPEMRGSFQDALLRSSSRELINVFDLAYSRAVSLNQVRRVRLDEKDGRYLVEKQVLENGRENFVPADDVPAARGELDSRITATVQKPGEAATEDDSRPVVPDSDSTSARGVAIDFYPDGTSDAKDIMLRDPDGFRLLLHLNPVTAQVHIVEMPRE